MSTAVTATVPGTVARMRIAAGAVRQRAALSFKRARLRPRIAAGVAPTLRELAALRQRVHGEKALVGVLLAEHYGDIVAAEPVVAHLRDKHPRAEVVWFCKPAYQELLEAHPGIDHVLPLNSILEAEFVVRSGLLDVAADLHVAGKPCNRYGLSYAKRSGDPSIDTTNYYHQGALLEALSLSAALPRLKQAPTLHLPQRVQATVDALQLPRRFIVFHGLSNEAARNWSAPKWKVLLNDLAARLPHRLVEIGLESVLPGSDTDHLSLCGRLSVAEAAEVMRRAEIFIGIDSGPAQCANALQTPSVILLGKYLDFGDYMPYTGFFRENESRMILRSSGACSEIPPEAVAARVEALLR